MTTCAAIYRVAGDAGADLYSEFEGVDLTDKSVSMTVRYESGGELNKEAVIDDATAGTFHFVWAVGDLVEGVHRLEYTLVDGTSIRRYPSDSTLALVVRAQV